MTTLKKVFFKVEILPLKFQLFSVNIINCLGFEYPEHFLISLQRWQMLSTSCFAHLHYFLQRKIKRTNQPNKSCNEHFRPRRVRIADKGKGVPPCRDSPPAGRDSIVLSNGHLHHDSAFKNCSAPSCPCAAGKHAGGKSKGKQQRRNFGKFFLDYFLLRSSLAIKDVHALRLSLCIC